MSYVRQIADLLAMAALRAATRLSAAPPPVPVPVRVRRRERGASLVEYALLVALIALVCIGAVTLLGSTLNDQYSSVADGFD